MQLNSTWFISTHLDSSQLNISTRPDQSQLSISTQHPNSTWRRNDQPPGSPVQPDERGSAQRYSSAFNTHHTSHTPQTTNHKPHTTYHTPHTTHHKPQAAHFLMLPRDHHPHDGRETGSNPERGVWWFRHIPGIPGERNDCDVRGGCNRTQN